MSKIIALVGVVTSVLVLKAFQVTMKKFRLKKRKAPVTKTKRDVGSHVGEESYFKGSDSKYENHYYCSDSESPGEKEYYQEYVGENPNCGECNRNEKKSKYDANKSNCSDDVDDDNDNRSDYDDEYCGYDIPCNNYEHKYADNDYYDDSGDVSGSEENNPDDESSYDDDEIDEYCGNDYGHSDPNHAYANMESYHDDNEYHSDDEGSYEDDENVSHDEDVYRDHNYANADKQSYDDDNEYNSDAESSYDEYGNVLYEENEYCIKDNAHKESYDDDGDNECNSDDEVSYDDDRNVSYEEDGYCDKDYGHSDQNYAYPDKEYYDNDDDEYNSDDDSSDANDNEEEGDCDLQNYDEVTDEENVSDVEEITEEILFLTYNNILENLRLRFSVSENAIKIGIEKLIFNYKNLNQCETPEILDFDDKAICLGYLHRYATCHSALVYHSITQVLSTSPLFSFSNDSKLNVMCLGSGPGNDFLGFLFALSDCKVKLKGIDVTAVDIGLWWETIFSETIEELNGLTEEESGVQITKNFIQADLSNSSSWNPLMRKKLNSAHVITLVKVLSCIPKDNHFNTLKNIVRHMEDGAFLVIIDCPLPSVELDALKHSLHLVHRSRCQKFRFRHSRKRFGYPNIERCTAYTRVYMKQNFV